MSVGVNSFVSNNAQVKICHLKLLMSKSAVYNNIMSK